MKSKNIIGCMFTKQYLGKMWDDFVFNAGIKDTKCPLKSVKSETFVVSKYEQ